MKTTIAKQIKKTAEIIGSTLGPNGNLVAITTENETILTKDGYKVSQNIKDNSEGANFVRQVCKQQVRKVGDGCQPLWEKILTPTGYITFADVKAGDIILGSDGKPQKVLKVYEKGEKELLRLTFSHKESVVCSPDHMWTLKNVKTGKYENKKVEEIYDNLRFYNDRLLWELPPKPVAQFAEQEITIDPFILGAYLGDGNILFDKSRPNCPRVCFTLGNKKQSVFEKIYEKYPEDDICEYIEKSSYVRLRIAKDTGRKIYKQLCDLDLADKTALTKFIPANYLFNSVSVREELFNGLIATDGTIKGGKISYTTASGRLAEDVKLLAQSLGYNVYMKKRVREEHRPQFKKKEYVCYDLVFYKGVSKLEKIEHLGYKEPVRCIKVSNQDELYLTSNCLLTHNTTSVAVLLAHLMDYKLKDLYKLRSYIPDLKDYLGKIATKKITKESLYNVAMVSSNADESISQAVSSVVYKNGRDGHYIVEEKDIDGIETEQITGYVLDAGYTHQAFVNTKSGCEMKDPVILVKEYVTLADMAEQANQAMNANRPFLIIGQCDEQVLASLVANHLKGVGQFCNIRPSQIGAKLKDIMADLTALSGHIKVAHIRKRSATFEYDDDGSIKQWVDGIKGQEAQTQPEKEWQKERIARLESRIAKVYVGAETTAKMIEVKDRLEDTLLAVIQAYDGYVVGGGQALKMFGYGVKSRYKVWGVINKKVGVKDIPDTVVEPANLVYNTFKTAVEQAILVKRTHYAI